VADAWQRDSRRYLSRQRRYERHFRRQLTKDYGGGLDLLRTFIALSADLGQIYQGSVDLEDRDPHALEVSIRLHARACRVALEVHSLLTAGLPNAAIARTRTLHEISVVSTLIADHEDSHPDLAERYFLHDAVLNRSDARVYQDVAAGLGLEQFEDDFIESTNSIADDLIGKYGPPYKKPYGWAAHLIGNPDPKFDQLEKAAGLEYLRGHYKWATREVHADSKGLRLNTIERGDVIMHLAGATNLGLVEPAGMCLRALHSVNVNLVLSKNSSHPSHGLYCAALSELISRVEALLAAGEAAVEQREETLQSLPRDPGRVRWRFVLLRQSARLRWRGDSSQGDRDVLDRAERLKRTSK